ncbi:MAG TPA: NlpC/P60 family protein [Hyphomicrobiaceae bacterium]|nr:NlpC/P60 family protein [Hyphomicrobiaceae bacterium]
MPQLSRDAIVAAARGWLGTPYHHQASRRGVGADCLGLVRGVWRELYGEEPETPPPYTRDWSEASGEETLLAAARRHLLAIDPKSAAAGDVIVFRLRAGLAAKHAAIRTGEATFIHAMEGAPVAEAALTPWWRRRIAGAFRFPGLGEPDAAGRRPE